MVYRNLTHKCGNFEDKIQGWILWNVQKKIIISVRIAVILKRTEWKFPQNVSKMSRESKRFFFGKIVKLWRNIKIISGNWGTPEKFWKKLKDTYSSEMFHILCKISTYNSSSIAIFINCTNLSKFFEIVFDT